MKPRTKTISPRYRTTGNSRPHEVTPRAHRRDSAWRDMVHGTQIEPMADERGLLARIFGRRA